jgi:hypothetical protein
MNFTTRQAIVERYEDQNCTETLSLPSTLANAFALANESDTSTCVATDRRLLGSSHDRDLFSASGFSHQAFPQDTPTGGSHAVAAVQGLLFALASAVALVTVW